MTRVLKSIRGFFDIRSGEHLRLWAMFSYLLFVLFAYYIVKPVSRALFLTRFDVDKLPLLYILIALFGGVLAYFYSRLASKVSLRAAVAWTMGLSIATLVVMWWLIRMRIPWMVYVLNIWVSLFSVILVSQGWLVASNLFNAREAKRLYPVLDLGMVLGAAFGGEFTKRTVLLIGTESLLLASAVMVALAYVSFAAAQAGSQRAVQDARAAREEETDFSFGRMIGDLGRVRHLRIIVGMMVVMYLVDTLVEYQFQVMAKGAYRGDNLTAFFGQFYGLWLNGIEFIFQLFLTGLVVRWFGVGATLQISPVAVAASSVAILAAPGVAAASAVRLTEASTRYTLSKTGMELLYMPLPLALRNRIKAFIDICVDRLSRGIGGVLLLLLTTSGLHLGIRGISVMVIALSGVWILYAIRARREYVASIRKQLSERRLDLASIRVAVTDSATIKVLEEAAAGPNPRQATYALSLLAEVQKYDITPILLRSARSPLREVRSHAYSIATKLKFGALEDDAAADTKAPLLQSAVTYALALSPNGTQLAAEMLQSDDVEQVEAALEALKTVPGLAPDVLDPARIVTWANSDDPRRRALAARAAGLIGESIPGLLLKLLADPAPSVVAASLRAAGDLKSRAYLFPLIRTLGDPRVRRDAVQALAAFGDVITGTLSDVLNDDAFPSRVQRAVPRVFTKVASQRSVNALLPAITHMDPSIRTAVLKALNRIRETSPQLNFQDRVVTDQLLREARHYYELSAALAAFRGPHATGRPALRLLQRTLEDRLKGTLDRLFRLLGLRYPPKDIYSAYLAFSRPAHYDASAALEFLDNVLDRDLKRVLLPLLDAPQYVLDHGRNLFGVHPVTAEQAIRSAIQSGDSWLVVCAMAAAAELGIRNLAAEIGNLSREGSWEISRVARSAQAALA